MGSPPRGRGKDLSLVGLEPHTGITPAWAGKSHWMRLVLPVFEDHPRVGGEKFTLIFLVFFAVGSPPRGRGKVFYVPSETLPKWITPAWAGKSVDVPARICHDRDHPRVGGEKAAFHAWLCCILGSPPRGRGKGCAGVKGRSPFRITPAWAGKSTSESGYTALAWDHPRVGGEKVTG